jgi:hypothetical protein
MARLAFQRARTEENKRQRAAALVEAARYGPRPLVRALLLPRDAAPGQNGERTDADTDRFRTSAHY